MKHAIALLLTAVGLSACAESVGPRPDKRLAVASFSEAVHEQEVPGSAAAFGLLFTPEATADDPSVTASPGVVVPDAYTNVMGESNNTFPHAFSPMRYQQVFLESELEGLRAINGLCLRRDQFAGGPAGTQQLTVKLGPTQLNHVTLTPVFDANYAGAPTTVFSGPVNIPPSSGGGTPDDFYLCIDFTTIYVHPDGNNLLIEVVNTSQNRLIHFVDACQANVGCTTRRVFAFAADAPVGVMDPFFYGLVMKLNRADPTSKDDCKDGGWERFGFKNQGQCIRFVETGEDSR